ncbi:MAG: 1,6-anhydro-N-acetylmuramyl-L-alanine amidase AmpD [Gammaproteobacteria bacterium CG22_combo_CG10-13_8_21_14_all_40_8]|nr:MAG: 1,6-anhydro-N-acetylmuramyl-L-alanine amidase AmpD [Gammaproteobacteria bacterium CG22_combo_CG10-13_8_21_14_all_40_8]
MDENTQETGIGDDAYINHEGWLSRIEQLFSENHNERPLGIEPSLLVIHCISLPPEQYGSGHIQQFFTNQLHIEEHPYFETIKDLRVSAHFLITRCGRVIQFVSTEKRAWHAGLSSFEGCDNCNDFSIGIELEGSEHSEYEEQQYQSLIRLTQRILSRYPKITLNRIVAHSDIAPDRKTDPGEFFNWTRLHNALQKWILTQQK